MDELLQRALERQRTLRAELEILDKFIRSYVETKDRSASTADQAELFEPIEHPSRRASRARRAAQIASMMDDAEKLILEAGRPLTRSALLSALTNLGHEIEGTDKSKVLGTNIWRSKRFHNLKGSGYWPRSAPIPIDFSHLAFRPSMLLDDGQN
jgi:hypothetical protein